MRKIEMDKSYEEVDIGGNVYKIEMNDQKKKEYRVAISEYEQWVPKINNYKELNDEERQKLEEEAEDKLRELVELFFGEGTFDGIYETANYYQKNVEKILGVVYEILEEERQKGFKAARDKYVKKK